MKEKIQLSDGLKATEITDDGATILVEKVEKKQGRWKLDDGQLYYHFTGILIDTSHWADREVDNYRYLRGNCYQTEKEAEKALERDQALTRILQYIDDNFGFWEPDWEDGNQAKYNLFWSYRRNKASWCFYYSHQYHTNGIPYLEKKEHIEQLIKDCEDDIRKHFTGK